LYKIIIVRNVWIIVELVIVHKCVVNALNFMDMMVLNVRNVQLIVLLVIQH